MVKNLPTVWENWVLSLSLEDPLEKGTATHSSILAWRIPWTEEAGGLQSVHEIAKSRTQLSKYHFDFHRVFLKVEYMSLKSYV